MSPEMIDPLEYHQLFVDDYPLEISSCDVTPKS